MFHIVGIERSGTNSLAQYFFKKLIPVISQEWIYCFRFGPQIHQRYFPTFRPIMIVREPVERCWSDYHFAIQRNQIPKVSYEEALEKFPRFAQGSCYEKWINFWTKNNSKPIVVKLKEMEKFVSVLHKNETKPEISKKQTELTLKAIEKAKNQEFFRESSEVEYSAFLSHGLHRLLPRNDKQKSFLKKIKIFK